MMPFMQIPLGSFSGVYDVSKSMIDFDQGIMRPSLYKYEYFSPAYSIMLWIILAAALTLAGTYLLKRKEVY